MTPGQWRLLYPGVDYTFGTGDLPVFNKKTPEFGTTDVRTSDNDRPRGDGRSFGVDYFGGQTVSFDLGVRAPSDAEVREETAVLRSIWRADPVRLTPGAVAELQLNYAGRVRSVFGRPRRFAPDYSDAAINRYVQVLADFACVDDLFYGPAEEPVEFNLVPSTDGGLIAPLAAPLSTTSSSDRSQVAKIVSEEPVWPIVTLYGPITNAVVEVGPVRWEVRLDLNEGEWVTIDSRPWARTAIRNGTASVGGSIRGTRLAASALPAGTYAVGLRGMDPTGTSRLRLHWNKTYSAL